MKAKYKDLNLEGSPEEILMFYVISKFEKMMYKDLEKQIKTDKKSDEKRGKLYSMFTKKEEEGEKDGRGKSTNTKRE